MVTELQANDVILKHLASREAREEWRLMYRWATVFYYKNKMVIALSEPVSIPETNIALPFAAPKEDIGSLQTVKRVLVWQWNNEWVVVGPDELKAVWS